MKTDFNSELLAAYLQAKRGKGSHSVAANKIGISKKMLIDLENDKISSGALDVDSYIKICKWLDTSGDTFIRRKLSFRKSKSKDSKEPILLAFQSIAGSLSRIDKRSDQATKGLLFSIQSLIDGGYFPESVKDAARKFTNQFV